MRSLAPRYWLILIAGLVAALIAVWSYSYGGLRSDECIDSRSVLESTWIEIMTPIDEGKPAGAKWSFQTIEGAVPTENPRMSALFVRILRTFEPEKIYGDPVNLIYRREDFGSIRPVLKWIESDSGPLPVHEVIVEVANGVRIGSYMFLYDARPVSNPVLALFSNIPRRIATGRRPLTIVTATVLSTHRLQDEARRVADAALISAWERYRKACRR